MSVTIQASVGVSQSRRLIRESLSVCHNEVSDSSVRRIAVISIAPYVTDMGEHTALYKINNNVYIENSKIIIT